MAAARSQESSPSTSYTYQVFLSFRGKDTRKTFTGHLYTALDQAGFHTFRDDNEIERGLKIKSELEKGIQQSRASIIVFSSDYASSRWCLDELVMILERTRTSGHIVIPVFYDVDPCDIRHQLGSIGKAFERYQEKLEKEIDDERKRELTEKVKKWKKALTEAADLSGMELKKQANGDESKFIQEVVHLIQDKLSRKGVSVAPYLVGMHSRARNINLWLQNESTDVCVMAICGMGGSGKTTLAEFVYDHNFKRFDGSSFLANIREVSEKHEGLICLQKQLISDIGKRNKEKIYNIGEGIRKIKDILAFKRVLIVLDDVDHTDQLNAIIGMQDWFTQGSKIIITTSRERLLRSYEAYEVNRVEMLNHLESIQLFTLHAFGQDHPPRSYMDHTENIVERCEGLPLALQILGSSLSGQNIDIWANALEKLKKIANGDILKKLKISFDSLEDDDVRQIFLHIACFFVGEDKDRTIKILDACNLYSTVGIQNLIDRHMLSISYDKLWMHQLVKDMGREIVRLESYEPGKRSRLWNHEDCYSVLREKTGTDFIQAFSFDMQIGMKGIRENSFVSKINKRKRGFEEVLDNPFHWFKSLKRRASNFLPWHPMELDNGDLETDAFTRMQQLKLLQLNYVSLRGSYKEFPKRLRWLSWHGFHLEFIPCNLTLNSLVCLDMKYSSLRRVWKGNKFLPSLKILNLSHSEWLSRTPNFSEMPNLEILIFKGCIRLIEVCESIGFLERLTLLDLSDCTSLKELPRSMNYLRSLKNLTISGCSSIFYSRTRELQQLDLPCGLVKLSLRDCNLSNESFPKDFSNLPFLEYLYLSKNLIQSLPDCIRTLTRLKKLDLSYCPLLQSVLGLPSSLRNLSVFSNESLKRITSTSNLCSLKCWLCDNLVDIEGLYKSVPIKHVDKRITKNMGLIDFQLEESYKVSYEFGIFSVFFPGTELRGRFDHKNTGSRSISFTVASFPDTPNRIRGLNVCFAYVAECFEGHQPRYHGYPWSKIINMTKDLHWEYRPKNPWLNESPSKGIMLNHWRLGNLIDVGDQVRVEILENGRRVKVKELGIKVVYEDDDEEEEEEEMKETIQKQSNRLSWTEEPNFELQLSGCCESRTEYILHHDRILNWFVV